jgi:nicotinamide-nucleotide amidase
MTVIRGKASIIAVGTELTSGQITNRNAPWIAEKLVNLGVDVILHETVADDHLAIQSALDHCSNFCQFLFVTGGLGPTTDDFTRDVIAKWLVQPLQFDELSWERIVKRLDGFGIPVASSNRQQCYFPKGSDIIPNFEGTASGFTAPFGQSQRIWVLPGPPQEVSSVWAQGIESQICGMCPELKPSLLMTWQCLGKSEAELGEITEKALDGSGLKTGYRAHRPFVEIKVWVAPNELESKKTWLQNLERAIAPWLFTRQGEDLAETLLSKLKSREYISVMDRASVGGLANRVGSLISKRPELSDLAHRITWVTEFGPVVELEEWVSTVLQFSDEDALTLVIGGFTEDGRCVIGMREGRQTYKEVIQSPWRRVELLDRTRLYSIEIALKRWIVFLDQQNDPVNLSH